MKHMLIWHSEFVNYIYAHQSDSDTLLSLQVGFIIMNCNNFPIIQILFLWC